MTRRLAALREMRIAALEMVASTKWASAARPATDIIGLP
jgi:hypothetical protein